MTQPNQLYRIITLVALSLLVLAPVQAEATSHSLLTKLCAKILTCGLVADPILPRIESLDFPKNPTPGKLVTVRGKNFGSAKGLFFLSGLKKWNGEPYDIVFLYVSEGSWTPTRVTGILPKHITGVKDQQATLQIYKPKAGQFAFWPSNEYPVNFSATREYKHLPWSDVTLVSCGTDANFDNCNGWGDPDDGELAGYWQSDGATLSGSHDNCWGCIGDDFGIDVFEITLHHDWRFHFMQVSKEETGGTIVGPSGFVVGNIHWRPEVVWNVTPNDNVEYHAYVDIVGPAGVPHTLK